MDDLLGWAKLLAQAVAQREDQPRRICDLCVENLDIAGAGISMMTVSGSSVVCATDDIAAAIEELQLTLGEGPCIDSVHAGAPVLIADLDEPDDISVERWPGFMTGAAESGVRAVFAFPLRLGAMSVGAMDLYRDSPGELEVPELSAALMAADAAALAVLNLDSDYFEPPPGFEPDPRSSFHVQVHQATGMVQVQLGVTTEEAFLALRARSFSSSRPLAELAVDVVERRIRFSKEDA